MGMRFIYRRLLLFFLFPILLAQPAAAQTNPPSLRIAFSNGVSTVFWPLTGYEDILQTATSFSPAATWTNLATGDQIVNIIRQTGGDAIYTTNVIGNEIAFSLPAANGQQFFRLSTPLHIPACAFAVFYNGLLEFSQTATMIVNGRVHANGPIYVGTTASLTFNAPVTTSANITAPLVDGLTSGWTPGTPSTWNATFNGNPGSITNIASLGIPGLNPTNYHFMVDIPPANEDPMSPTGQLRLYNEAEFVLLVTNAASGTGSPTIQIILQSSQNGAVPGDDPSAIFFNLHERHARTFEVQPVVFIINQYVLRSTGTKNQFGDAD
jgi:hypothetical protein